MPELVEGKVVLSVLLPINHNNTDKTVICFPISYSTFN
ncbi:hypothetical protein ADICYQ_4405 [Cyclobacterium qasimii M12-11B]|uniref:Uncharacterized protein n=1 Tax=Cyclobacterium qasimii M12-11B TaxID=641524 RepID=S7WR91_9BACT|nr:hypothetical protein ADICYQ_4405 [Cyclobacterium qasimii M12-11B]